MRPPTVPVPAPGTLLESAHRSRRGHGGSGAGWEAYRE